MPDEVTLKEQFLHAMLRFKKTGMEIHQKSNINMRELLTLESIAENAARSKNNINVSVLQRNLHVTQAAISQMLNSLEKKGYIVRDIDKTNRRKITVAPTQKGTEMLKNTKEQLDQMMEKIISRFGEENTRHLIMLLERLSDISDEIKHESIEEGDDIF